MSLFNEKLKNIPLMEFLFIIIFLFLIQYFLNSLKIIHIDSVWLYVLIIFYFIFKLRHYLPDSNDFLELFSQKNSRQIIQIVILNIFLSYGFLYLSDYILKMLPAFNLPIPHMIFNSAMGVGLLATVVVSPISEELIFRGMFLNKLNIVVPPIFAVLISSLLFASLHTYGNITSAFIFAICMAILYIKTNNILIPIFAHFLNNLFAEIILFMDGEKILFTNNSVMFAVSILAIVSFILISIFIIKELNNIK